jgi:hypothetical protein
MQGLGMTTEGVISASEGLSLATEVVIYSPIGLIPQ